MVAKASIIKNYAKADAAGKVDIICKNYSNFIGIVDGYTEGLCYMIENEKAYNRTGGYNTLNGIGSLGTLNLCNLNKLFQFFRSLL